MRYLILLIGILLILTAGASMVRYIFDYNILTVYGRGFVWGKIIMLLTGILLSVISLRKINSYRQNDN